jgi:acylphosphatase
MSGRVRLEITGRVQGVGFRWYTREKARRWGLSGWVRNLADGSVEVVAEGDDASISGLVEMLKQGPPGAHVRDVRSQPFAGDAPLPSPFTVLK